MLAVFPNSSSHYALRQALSMNLEHIDMASLARFAPIPANQVLDLQAGCCFQLACELRGSISPHAYYWYKQAYCLLSHFLSPIGYF